MSVTKNIVEVNTLLFIYTQGCFVCSSAVYIQQDFNICESLMKNLIFFLCYSK
jgi:hypothetical protein